MGSLTVGAAPLLPFMFALLFEASSVLSQDLRETDAVCKANGCFVVYFQRKTFLDAWKACNEGGGSLATIKHHEEAATVAGLFSTLDLRYSRSDVQVWIGLQRQPRQCSPTRVLRGFSWTTGDQDTEFTNWLKEDSPSTCSVPRCVSVSYSTQESKDNLKWLDGPCSVHIDGYLCHYAYKGTCPALWREGAASILYTTPFNLQSSLLTHVPLSSVATVFCLSGSEEKLSCVEKGSGSVGWSSESPICSSPTASYDACDLNNGGCEHLCRMEGAYFFCECEEGFQLRDDGRSCELLDACDGDPCEHECVPLPDGHRCACPEGYMLAPDERSCLDVDECLQSPCDQVCVNTPGAFECQCLDGYQADGEAMCKDVDECINEPCEHACENEPGSYICHCYLGFSPVPGNFHQCQDIDECQISGTCQQMCANYEGGFECYCREGYELTSDHYTCSKINEYVDYDWKLQVGHTDWPLEEDHTVAWLTAAPRVHPDVIWVTSASEEPDLPAPGAPHDEEDISIDAAWQISQTEVEGLDDVTSTTPPHTSSSTTPDLYEDGNEETTITVPFISTSTFPEGAWNWWSELTTQEPGPTVSARMAKGPTNPSQEEEKAHIPVESVELTRLQYPTAPTRSTASPSPLSEAEDGGDPPQKQTTWLLVGLLVPIGIIIVVMVVLCVVCGSRCTIKPRSKNATDCYHWISGAHDKQGVANPSAGVRGHV